MKKLGLVLVALFMVSNMASAQQILDALGVNLLLFGGDQKSITTTVEVQPIAIIDIEPEGELLTGMLLDELEAGKPAISGSAGLPENLWINFTHRTLNYQPARIYVSTNQPVPVGMTLKVEIVQVGSNGSFPANPRFGQVVLSQTEEVIVYDFGNGYTGDGVGSGYRLKYTLENPNSLSLPEGFQIIYRIG